MNDSVAKEAITREQEKAFLNFVKDDKHFSKYYEGSIGVQMATPMLSLSYSKQGFVSLNFVD